VIAEAYASHCQASSGAEISREGGGIHSAGAGARQFSRQHQLFTRGVSTHIETAVWWSVSRFGSSEVISERLARGIARLGAEMVDEAVETAENSIRGRD
jgi:hypothetical protein